MGVRIRSKVLSSRLEVMNVPTFFCRAEVGFCAKDSMRIIQSDASAGHVFLKVFLPHRLDIQAREKSINMHKHIHIHVSTRLGGFMLTLIYSNQYALSYCVVLLWCVVLLCYLIGFCCIFFTFLQVLFAVHKFPTF